MTLVLIAVFALYITLVICLCIGWRKAIREKVKRSENSNHVVSVIVPIRNEESNVESLVHDLILQSFPSDRFEVIVVDDHSTDQSVVKVNNFIRSRSNFKLIQSFQQGKKAAITEGVRQANGSLIVTTDADCKLGNHWLQSIESMFTDESIKMVFGAVRIGVDQSLFSVIQAIEFSSLIGSGAATMTYGIPTMSNGANLAFRKAVFEQVKGYDGNNHVASGDDEFLMRKISRAFENPIRFNNSSDAIVETKPQPSLDSFLSQRLRWASKWKHHRDWKSKVLAVFIFVFHATALSLPVLVMMGEVNLNVAVLLFGLKTVVEFVLLYSVTSWLQIRWHWLSFLVLQFLYPLYALYVGFVSLFAKPVWKGRK